MKAVGYIGAMALCLGVLLASGALADGIAITRDVPNFSFMRNGAPVRITRQAQPNPAGANLTAGLSMACPPYCIQPMQIAPGVETVGELELMAFLAGPVSEGRGLLVDARLAQWYAKGTIPGAVSMPYPALDASNAFLPDILRALGARDMGGTWDFSAAFDLLIFGNGAWSDMAAQAISGLIGAGYPPGKLRWYRSGLDGWAHLGLTVAEGAQ